MRQLHRFSMLLLPLAILSILILIAASWTANPTAIDQVVWTNLVNCVATDNSITKTMGMDAVEDSGALSFETIESGDGFIEFVASGEPSERTCGLLSITAAPPTSTDFDYAIHLSNRKKVFVYEHGIIKAKTRYKPNNKFRVSVEGDIVKYYKNDEVFYASDIVPSYPMIGATSLATLGASVSEVMIAGGRALLGVRVRPNKLSLLAGATTILTAIVTGSTDTRVTWSATGGSIIDSGTYSAPSTPGQYIIIATSVADPSATDSTIIDVTSSITTTTIYVAPNGLPTNSGSSSSPIDLATAVSSSGPVRAGYTVVLRAGIYRYSSLTFAPAGTSPSVMTVFKAAPAERVIITSPSNTPPDIYMGDYMRLDGLWIGGARQSSDLTGIYLGGSPISHWKQIVNCTIFGYFGAIKASETEYAFLQGNRFVKTGGGNFYHSIYISSNDPFPGPAGTATQHNIVDNNMFVAGGDGYAVHFWHNNHTNIITRNAVFSQGMGIVHDGSDALVANNFLWRTTHEAMWMPGQHEYIVNNVFGQSADFVGTDASNTTNRNAYSAGVTTLGTNRITLTSGQETAQIGMSAASIDAAISALDNAFSGSIDIIFANTSIEQSFATLSLSVPSGSPLFQTGVHWFGSSSTNLGPYSLSPTTIDNFWQAFRALGLKEFDSNGKVIP